MEQNSFVTKCCLELTLLLAVTVWGCGFCGAIQDGREGSEEDAALADRVRTLESLLTQQGVLLHQQAQKLAQQDILVAEKLSAQDVLLHAQAKRLDQQENLIHAQAKHLDQQEALLHQQEKQLSQQDTTIRQLKQAVTQLQEDLANEEWQTWTPQTSDNVSKPKAEEEEEAWTRGGRPEHDDVNTQHSLPHHVVVRSDDSGPLQVVVGQVGQQLSVLKADFLAFKTDIETQMTSEIHSLKNVNMDQDQKIQDAKTSTFVHWGSSQCGDASQLVYSGVVGGSHYTQTGAATNFLCLTMSPVPSGHAVTKSWTLLYGAEYETKDSHENMDPVCAMCRSPHSTTIVIPGTNVCTLGWHRQYSGYLMAGHHTHAAGTEFICVDCSLESRPGSNSDQDGKLLYFTKAVCGSLPCEPYVEGEVVTCVVCSN